MTRITMDTILLAILMIGMCSAQETQAESKGQATIGVTMSKSEFAAREMQWRDTVSWHASIHCKKVRDNCWTDDKQIRYHDVVIMDVVETNTKVDVTFHIRDRYDHSQAGMSSQQVRSFYLDYEVDMEDDFGLDMEFVYPGDPGMEDWLIAVIVISCVVGLALIIAVAVLASKQHKYKQEKKRIEELASDHSAPKLLPLYMNLPEGVENVVYDSDTDRPTTSNGSEKRASASLHAPPPYSNHERKSSDASDRSGSVKGNVYDSINL